MTSGSFNRHTYQNEEKKVQKLKKRKLERNGDKKMQKREREKARNKFGSDSRSIEKETQLRKGQTMNR